MKTPIKCLIVPLLFAALILLAGCVVTSVYPYYTPRDVIYDEALVGTWSEEGKEGEPDTNWQFSRAHGQTYTLVIRDSSNEVTELEARLFKLKDRRFIDAVPTKRENDFIPPHYLLQVHQLGANELELSMMSYKWLEELVERKPSAIAHVWVDRDAVEKKSGKVVLTANTKQLQAFLVKYAGDTNAFAEQFKMVRR